MSTTMNTVKDERSAHHRDFFAEFIPSANSGQALSPSKGSQ